jgi:Glycosyl hydrolase family 26
VYRTRKITMNRMSENNIKKNSGSVAGYSCILILSLSLSLVTFNSAAQTAAEELNFLRSLGNGHYLFGQMATWVHNENPDMDNQGNWIRKVYDHTGRLPRYGCITYDFADDPFTDAEWNEGVKKMWDRGMIVGVFSFYANPTGRAWNEQTDIGQILAQGENAVKTNFYHQMDRMAANLQWLKERKIPVVYTPFVESNDKNKWHAKEGSDKIIRLYRLVHDYFKITKGLDNIIWAYHTTQGKGALEENYPGDDYVDIIGKSAYGTGLIFSEYNWAVEKKKNHGKVIWWSELGIRGPSDRPVDCMEVVKKLEGSFPELAGFVFWSDEPYYNVTGNINGAELMADPKIITLK